MSMDTGNDAMLSAAGRYYDRMYGDDVRCAGCDERFTPDEDTLSSGDENFCDETCARLKLWCRDFVHEVLFEDEGERSAFFPRNYRVSEEQHYHAIAAE